jgi:crossover junction endodeoxyribonuclease RusA
MTAAISFGLPFPAKVLWPNGRPAHWAEKARAVKSARKAAWAAALAAGVKSLPASGRYAIAVTVYPKTRNAIDADNAVSSLKASLDGIADALGVDDRTFDTPSISFGEPVKGGLLSLTLTVNPQPQSGE